MFEELTKLQGKINLDLENVFEEVRKLLVTLYMLKFCTMKFLFSKLLSDTSSHTKKAANSLSF